MLNFSQLLHNSIDTCFLSNLNLDDYDKGQLNDAKILIRSTLKSELPKVLKEITGEIFEAPKFFTQGSWAYKTLNAPAQLPQQADLDDGCYLPLSYLQEIKKPSHATAIFFQAVEQILQTLANNQGWKLVTDKPTCTRLEISEKSHVDIPLYAISDTEFTTLKEAANLRGMTLDEALAKYESWSELPDDAVLLAHRVDDWVYSDPRLIKDWFNEECSLKGEQLRRVVRYLKGFRDQRWAKGGPSSILLMAAAAPIFVKNDRRDDMALLEVVRLLPEKLREGVKNPKNPSEILTDRLSKDELEDAAKAFEHLTKILSGCINASDPTTVCIWLRKEFGDRLPNRSDLVTATTATESIKDITAVITASPLIGRTEAG